MLRFTHTVCIVFYCMPVRVSNTVKKVAMGQAFLLVLWSFFLGNNKPTFYTQLYLSPTLYFLTDIVVKIIYLKQQS